MKIVIGSRGSALALWQTEFVMSELKASNPGIEIDIKKIKTTGDKILDVALAKIGDKGLFVKEIEESLVRGEIDLAVHSMKDVPTNLPEGLCISAILEREDNHDVFISDSYRKMDELPQGASIGTSSLRRIAQLMCIRPDLKFKDLRGNLQTRLKKMSELKLDGIILAAAGVKRLGYHEKIRQFIPYDLILPAVGQGSIGIEIKSNNDKIKKIIAPLNHEGSYWAILSERALLRRLEGGCQVPIGSWGRVEKGKLVLNGVIASLDGRQLYKAGSQGEIKDAEKIGIRVAEDLLAQGGDKILKEIYELGIRK
ncbi:MAG: hydroxymethylbilane synthase [bacterium]|nr:hydroxymethylbilane synthase [bacterium]